MGSVRKSVVGQGTACEAKCTVCCSFKYNFKRKHRVQCIRFTCCLRFVTPAFRAHSIRLRQHGYTRATLLYSGAPCTHAEVYGRCLGERVFETSSNEFSAGPAALHVCACRIILTVSFCLFLLESRCGRRLWCGACIQVCRVTSETRHRFKRIQHPGYVSLDVRT